MLYAIIVVSIMGFLIVAASYEKVEFIVEMNELKNKS